MGHGQVGEEKTEPGGIIIFEFHVHESPTFGHLRLCIIVIVIL